MGFYIPGVFYDYIGTTLSNTSKTACLTVGSGRAGDCSWVDVLAITISDSTGSVDTPATVYIYDGSTERVLYPSSIGLPTPTENLQHDAAPIHLDIGGEIRVTGASGHHVHIAFAKGIKSGVTAQNYAGR
jgi:hypothetical protein